MDSKDLFVGRFWNLRTSHYPPTAFHRSVYSQHLEKAVGTASQKEGGAGGGRERD